MTKLSEPQFRESVFHYLVKGKFYPGLEETEKKLVKEAALNCIDSSGCIIDNPERDFVIASHYSLLKGEYMTIKDLNEDQILWLKNNIFYALDEEPAAECLTEEDLHKINWCEYPSQIPMEIVEKVYGGHSFVENDFFC